MDYQKDTILARGDVSEIRSAGSAGTLGVITTFTCYAALSPVQYGDTATVTRVAWCLEQAFSPSRFGMSAGPETIVEQLGGLEASQGLEPSAPGPSNAKKGQESIKVVVRIRPLLEHEAGPEAVVAGEDNVIRVNGATPHRQLRCRYDAVIGSEVSQEGMFSHVRECTSAVLGGENSTVFAYGQTGSGKTYTMFGPDLDANGGATPGYGKGVIPLAVADLFKGLVRAVVTLRQLFQSSLKVVGCYARICVGQIVGDVTYTARYGPAASLLLSACTTTTLYVHVHN